MKKITVTILFCLLCQFAMYGENDKQLDSLLVVLDKTIQNRAAIDAKKIGYIDNLKKQLTQTQDNRQRFNIYGELFSNYKNFQMDSAFSVAQKRIELAQILNDPKDIIFANLNYAEVMTVTGMYKEALEIIESLDRKHFDQDIKSYVNHLNHSLYILMADYAISSTDKEHYKLLTYKYKDSILSILPPDNMGHMLVLSSKLLSNGESDKALEITKNCFAKSNDNSREIALTAHVLSEVYKLRGDKENRKKYLTISAIEDVRSSVKEYISLRQLAMLLYDDGDIDRAYSYLKCSMEDAIFCNARLRTLEISRLLPLINSTYDLKMKKEKERLVMLLVIISILSIVLVSAIVYIYRQLEALAKARALLKETNSDLQLMNENLNDVNTELSESNIVKEEYIGYVFNICSSYIDKLDDFRKKVNRKIQTGQTDELFRSTSSSSFVSDELKEFYKNFDTIFLNIYPDFVAEFNSLLVDEAHIVPREGELLNPELRIYALVKLGIGDSVKIASFLHYSPQTVYNYRLKVRNKAKTAKDNFPDSVRQIGRVKKSAE